MQKIIILGCPGSGKTTLANHMGKILGIKVHHLDKIFWVIKGGIKQDEFITHQEKIMSTDNWIIDGGFHKSKSYDLRIENADTIIFFNIPRAVIFWRIFKRFLKYFNTVRPDMGGALKERLRWSLIKFIWDYDSEAEHKKIFKYVDEKNVIILNNLKEEKRFLKELYAKQK